VVPEPAYVQSELVATARSAPPVTPREPERLVSLPMPELTPQGDGTSPGARRLAAFLETQKSPEPLPAPVRRRLLAGLGRRKSESR